MLLNTRMIFPRLCWQMTTCTCAPILKVLLASNSQFLLQKLYLDSFDLFIHIYLSSAVNFFLFTLID